MALALLSTAFFAWLSMRDHFLGNISDSAVYVALADFLSPYRATDSELGWSLVRDYAFPPLYPLLLAFAGAGSTSPALCFLATAAMQGAAVAAVYLWLRVEGQGTATALVLTLLFALAPATLLTGLGIQSEPLYVALVFGGFAALRRTRALGAALIGMSVLARVVGVSALAAALACWAFGRDNARRWSTPALVLLPGVLWALGRQLLDGEAGYVDLVRHDTLAATFDHSFAQLRVNGSAMVYAAVHLFDTSGSAHARMIVGGFALLAVIGWWRRLWRFEVDAVYCLLHLTILLVWPYPNHMRRFLQVLLPLFLLYGADSVKAIACRMSHVALRRAVMAAAMLALVLAMLPSSFGIIGAIATVRDHALAGFVRTPQWHRYASPAKAAAALERTADIFEAMRAITVHVPPTACVSSPLYEFVPLYGRRRAARLPGASRPAPELDAALARCPFVFMVAAQQWPPADYPPMYPYARIKDRLEVVEVTLWERAAARGTVLTMLGRIDAPRESGVARP